MCPQQQIQGGLKDIASFETSLAKDWIHSHAVHHMIEFATTSPRSSGSTRKPRPGRIQEFIAYKERRKMRWYEASSVLTYYQRVKMYVAGTDMRSMNSIVSRDPLSLAPLILESWFEIVESPCWGLKFCSFPLRKTVETHRYQNSKLVEK